MYLRFQQNAAARAHLCEILGEEKVKLGERISRVENGTVLMRNGTRFPQCDTYGNAKVLKTVNSLSGKVIEVDGILPYCDAVALESVQVKGRALLCSGGLPLHVKIYGVRDNLRCNVSCGDAPPSQFVEARRYPLQHFQFFSFGDVVFNVAGNADVFLNCYIDAHRICTFFLGAVQVHADDATFHRLKVYRAVYPDKGNHGSLVHVVNDSNLTSLYFGRKRAHIVENLDGLIRAYPPEGRPGDVVCVGETPSAEAGCRFTYI